MVANNSKRFVLLKSGNGGLPAFGDYPVRRCRNPREIGAALDSREWTDPKSIWISSAPKLTDALLRMVQQRPPRRTMGELVTIEPPRAASIPALLAQFRRVVGIGPAWRWLPLAEMADVLAAPADEAANLFIGGALDEVHRSLVLARGSLELVAVPLGIFTPSATGIQPNPKRLGFTDFGQSVRLGRYESSADAILYEVDPAYRRALNERRRASERTFGAALRRLRKQRRLGRDDFPPLSAKTIARLERSETAKAHGETLRIIADRLGVAPDQIATF